MKLSVIIPAYNVAEYIGECLDSIVNQTYRNLEIIVVNDGSTDNSREIIRRYESDSRIVLIDKPNGGLSDARNAGINKATGDFITFVDGDDLISKETYEVNICLFDEDVELDMVQYPVMFDWQSEHQYLRILMPEVINSENVFPAWWKNDKLIYSAGNKIYRKEVFHSIRFPLGKCFEDMYIVPELSQQIKKARISDKGVYYYRFREGSILNSTVSYSKHRNQLDAMLRIYAESFKFELNQARAEFWINIVWWQFYSLHHYNKNEQTASINKFKQFPLSLSDFASGSLSAKNRFRIIVLHLMGFRLMFNLFQLWKKLKLE